MIDIVPIPLAILKQRLAQYAGELKQIWPALNSQGDTSEKRPFVQLSYDELPDEEIDRVLGYEGIPRFNAPVGLPLEMKPIRLGANEYLLYPLSGLRNHLRLVARETVSDLEKAGSMDNFVAGRKSISALEYLVGGVWQCIGFCETNWEALSIRW